MYHGRFKIGRGKTRKCGQLGCVPPIHYGGIAVLGGLGAYEQRAYIGRDGIGVYFRGHILPKELLKRITVHPVHHYDELLPLVFEDKGSRGGASGTDKNRKNKEESKKETVAARPRKPAASGGGRKTGRPQPEAGA